MRCIVLNSKPMWNGNFMCMNLSWLPKIYKVNVSFSVKFNFAYLSEHSKQNPIFCSFSRVGQDEMATCCVHSNDQ